MDKNLACKGSIKQFRNSENSKKIVGMTRGFFAFLKRLGALLLNLIFPPRCIFCENLMPADTRINICKSCADTIPLSNSYMYLKTDKTEYANTDACDVFLWVYQYSGAVKAAIRRYKFHNKPSYFRTFSQILAYEIKNKLDIENIEMILCVPLHKQRERMRGYNQARLLSRAVSRELNIPDKSNLLVRVKNTKPQSLLGKEQRSENIKGAFRVVNENEIKGKKILLIDDILTTGATLNECARVLKEAGAIQVNAAVISSGRKY